MIDSIPAGLWKWFKSCAQITRLFFNFSDDKSGATAISPAGDTLLEDYIDGSQRRQYAFDLVRFLPLSTAPNDASNVEMIEDVESIVDWAREQDAAGNYPEMPSGCFADGVQTLETSTGYVAMEDQNMAKYMIPFALTYVKE